MESREAVGLGGSFAVTGLGGRDLRKSAGTGYSRQRRRPKSADFKNDRQKIHQKKLKSLVERARLKKNI